MPALALSRRAHSVLHHLLASFGFTPLCPQLFLGELGRGDLLVDRSRSASVPRGCPSPRIFPSSRTMILSAFRMVPIRWATIMSGGVLQLPGPGPRGAWHRSGSPGRRRSRRTPGSPGCRARARAMESRCFWPPDTLVPPSAMGAWMPPGSLSTNSLAWASSRAF